MRGETLRAPGRGAMPSSPRTTRARSFAYGLVCAAQVAGMFAVTFFCTGALAQLAWHLATGTSPVPPAPAIGDDEFERIVPDRPVPAPAPADRQFDSIGSK